MPRRPRSIAIIGWLFIAVGCGSLIRVAWLFPGAGLRTDELVPIVISLAAAVAGGAFLLAGAPWARWLLVAWMVFHIALSILHTRAELIVHVVLFTPIVVFLFRPEASAYLRRSAP